MANLPLNALRLLAEEADRILELEGDDRAKHAGLRQARDAIQHLAEQPPSGDRADQIGVRLATLLGQEPAPSEAAAALRREVARLRQDLSYLSHVERGGIGAVNSVLAELLERLQASETDRVETERIAGRLNDLLRRAIYLFPHLTTSVTVEVRLADEEFKAVVEQYLGRALTHRHELDQLWQACGQSRPPGRMVLHLPLPYLFAAQSTAGRRRARVESWEDLAFVPRRWVQRRDVRGGSAEARDRMKAELPSLLLVRTALSRELGISRSAVLLAGEVTRVAFTSEQDFLPAFNARAAAAPPQSRPDPLTHYLLFRDFGDIGKNPRLARALDIPQLADHSLFEPEYATGLLDISDDEASRQWLERGFGYLALLGRGHDSASLLRFERVEMKYDPSTSRSTKHSWLQCALYRAALDPRDPLRKHATEFDRAAIIAELCQVPVADRRFSG